MSPSLRNRHQEDGSLANMALGNRCNDRHLLANTVMHNTGYIVTAFTINNQQIDIRDIRRLEIRYATLSNSGESSVTEYAS